jgi:hypothetical protein
MNSSHAFPLPVGMSTATSDFTPTTPRVVGVNAVQRLRVPVAHGPMPAGQPVGPTLKSERRLPITSDG